MGQEQYMTLLYFVLFESDTITLVGLRLKILLTKPP